MKIIKNIISIIWILIFFIFIYSKFSKKNSDKKNNYYIYPENSHILGFSNLSHRNDLQNNIINYKEDIKIKKKFKWVFKKI